jgi:asparagine synthase (glutamine-hydrolysing)
LNETNAHWASECYAQAAADGCDAVLRADMGNAGFSYDGLTGFPSWFARGQWRRLLRELRASPDPRPFWRRTVSLAVWPHVPNRIRRWRDRGNPYRPSPFTTWCPLREDYAETSGALARARATDADFEGYECADSRSWRDQVSRAQLGASPEIYLGFQLAHGIALPDPTSFVPLLELCAGIADDQYLHAGTDRWLARRLLQGRVPEMVVNERRKGLQAADWPVRFAREREGLLAEIARLRSDPRMTAIFDLDRMAGNLADWDGTDTVAARSHWKINACVGRGVSTARFVRYVEGRNAG